MAWKEADPITRDLRSSATSPAGPPHIWHSLTWCYQPVQRTLDSFGVSLVPRNRQTALRDQFTPSVMTIDSVGARRQRGSWMYLDKIMLYSHVLCWVSLPLSSSEPEEGLMCISSAYTHSHTLHEEGVQGAYTSFYTHKCTFHNLTACNRCAGTVYL